MKNMYQLSMNLCDFLWKPKSDVCDGLILRVSLFKDFAYRVVTHLFILLGQHFL